MLVRNNYKECITNVACSIQKYFNISNKHNSIVYLDKILEQKKPKNVIAILFDGMGSNIIDRVLGENRFLVKHRIAKITTVFPATTVAALTAFETGLNPIETGMLGWSMYYKGIDKIINVFRDTAKDDLEKIKLPEAHAFKEQNMLIPETVDLINNAGKYSAYKLYPFGDNAYENLEDMCNRIVDISKKGGTKFIYAYDDEPDHTLHSCGEGSQEVKDIVTARCRAVEELASRVEDSVIIVVADHGHLLTQDIMIDDYPDIVNCLIRLPSMEPRATNFFVKPEKKKEFESLFNKYFAQWFKLYTVKEVLDSNLFGDGKVNQVALDSLGDYIAIAVSNKALLTKYDKKLVSNHAGYTDDEIYIPLIVI